MTDAYYIEDRVDKKHYHAYAYGDEIKIYEKGVHPMKTYYRRLVDLKHQPLSDVYFKSDDEAIQYFNKYSSTFGDDVLLVEEHKYDMRGISALRLDGVNLSTIAQLCDRWFNHQVRLYDSSYDCGITDYFVDYTLFSLQTRCAMFSYALCIVDYWEEGSVGNLLSFTNDRVPSHLDFKLIEGKENDNGYKEPSLPLGVALELNKLGGRRYWEVTDTDATQNDFDWQDRDFTEVGLMYQWWDGEPLFAVEDDFTTYYESHDMIDRIKDVIEVGIEEVNEDTLPRLIDSLIDEHIEGCYYHYFDGMKFWDEGRLQSIFGEMPFPNAKHPYYGLSITIDKQNREELERITMEDILQEKEYLLALQENA